MTLLTLAFLLLANPIPKGGLPNCTSREDGLLASIEDANRNTTRLGYDARGVLTSIADALGQKTEFIIDDLGRREELIKPNGENLTYIWDAGNRLDKILLPDGSEVDLDWDPDDLMTRLASPDIEVGYRWDRLHRLEETNYLIFGKILKYSYDEAGNRTRLEGPAGVIEYLYDDLDRLGRLVAPAGLVFSFAYDGAGRILQRLYPNGVKTGYGYDLAGRLEKLEHRKADGALLSRFAYGYDANGNRTSVADNLGRHTYGYDPLNRLVQVIEPFKVTKTYSYDPVGNRTNLTTKEPDPKNPGVFITSSIDYAYDIADRILTAGATTFAHDPVGRMTQIRAPPDRVTALEYDAFDRPKKISGLTSHLTGKPLPTNEFAYGPLTPDLRFAPAPLGHRIKKIDSQGITQYLIDDTGNTLAELDDKNAIRRSFTHSLNIDDPLSITDEFGHTYFMLPDGLGSVSMLVDREGDPVQLYTYEPFGKPNVTARDKNALKFTARPFDPDAQLQENRARYYDPEVGRWLTRDPLSWSINTPFFGFDTLANPIRLNPFVYVQNSPLHGNDPFGLFDSGWHREITRKALETFGIPERLLTTIVAGNIGQDNPFEEDRFFSSGAHFIKELGLGLEFITTRYGTLKTVCSAETAAFIFGTILHATQDFYAHSNWIDANRSEVPIMGLPSFISLSKAGIFVPTFTLADVDGRNTDPGSHSQINKDNEDRKGFPEARRQAVKDTVFQYGMFHNSLPDSVKQAFPRKRMP